MLGWRPDPIRHRALLEVIRYLEYDAVGIGDNEFIDGAPFLASVIRTHDLPAVTANIHVPDIQEWEQITSPYRIIRVGDLRVGVIGLGAPEAFKLMGPGRQRSLRIDPPDEMLRRMLPDIRKQADLIFVLSHAGIDADRDLARAVPGIDVIVGSYSRRPLFEPVLEKATLIVQAGKNGAHVGRLNLVLDSRKRIVEYNGRLDPLYEDIPDDPDVRRMIDDYQDRLQQEVERTDGQPSDDPPYLGAAACRPCHEAQYVQWQTTAHAHAFQSLINDHKETMPECLFCHTTGYGRPAGYRDLNTTRRLTDVQCEVCHRVSEQHGQAETATPVARVTPLLCIACHTPVRSPQFYYEEAMTEIRH